MSHPIGRRLVAAALACSLALPPIAATAGASEAPSPTSSAGINAAVACGLGVRVSVLSGGNTLAVITTIGACALMIFEALRTPD